MSFATFDLQSNGKKIASKKWPWYWAPIYCCVWFVLFYVAVIPSFYSYPEMLTIRDEAQHPDEFIGERAQLQLAQLAGIGNKMTGSINNEVHTVNFLMSEIQKIVDESRRDLYDIEAEVQYASGAFFLWSMAMSYDNVSNVVVKITSKNSSSDNYLLLNSHYDSEVKTAGAADDGVMVVIMLETLRVISRSERPLTHPVVFLFNGAEEANMLASHAFITTHRWRTNCKALINLDSTGSGGREVLFQTGPNHPWLVQYYKESAPHPYSSTIAEELFQNNFIPSDTDFRVFRDYGNVPGLDMAHALNGYVYHTKYDNFQNLERGTYQTTGDNVLAVTWALANAPELQDLAAHEKGHAVFYDYLGWFMVAYTERTSIIINIVVSVAALILLSISIGQMARRDGSDMPKSVLVRFCLLFLVHVASLAVAAGLVLIVALSMEGLKLTQSWYYGTWMTFGLYFCTMFFGMSMLPAIYIGWTKHKTYMKLNETIACFLHAHCIIMVVICLTMTGLGIRSAFFPMIGIFFYAISMLLQLMASCCTKKSWFVVIHLLCQVLPFWFYTYLAFLFLIVFIPMQGRDGPDSKPELLIAGFIIVVTLHFAGFIIPMLHKFQKTKTFCSLFGITTIVFIILAATPAGFPFKEAVAAQRYYVLHSQRILHNLDNTTTAETGYYIQPVDTRYAELYGTTLKDAEPASWTSDNCAAEPYCGLPLYSGRWLDWKDSAKWIYAAAPRFPITTELSLKSKKSTGGNKTRYEYSLKAADRIVMYISPYAGVQVTDWSFDRTPLVEAHAPPYFIYHVYSLVQHPFDFWIELEHKTNSEQEPRFKLGIGAHFLYHQESYTAEYKAFLNTFPHWAYTTDWLASYESWVY